MSLVTTYFRSNPLYVKVFFVIFYSVGVFGILNHSTSAFFVSLTPLALLMSVIALALFHEGTITINQIIVFLLITVLGYFVEVAGVNTGLIFGEYEYGRTLGFKIWNTPLMIGVNWLLLVYTSAAIVQNLRVNGWLEPFLATALMLLYDLVLEPIAPKIDMWTWQESIAPLQNYVAWGLVAFLFHLMLKLTKIKIVNSLALVIFICQFTFFLALFLL